MADRGRHRRRPVMLTAVLGLAVALGGCASRPGSEDAGVGAGEPIAIAVGAPLSGKHARAGQETLHAAQIAVDEANAAGGVNGHKIELVSGDDQGDPQNGQSVAQIFCDDKKVLAVIGHYNSGVTIPASTVYRKCGLAQITPLSSNPQVTERGLDNVFRVGARDDHMGPAVAAFLARRDRPCGQGPAPHVPEHPAVQPDDDPGEPPCGPTRSAQRLADRRGAARPFGACRRAHGPHSGGEQQMVAIARTLMARPRLLVLDEPSLGLSPLLVRTVFRAIAEIHRAGTSLLLVEQNAVKALELAERGYVISSGEVLTDGTSAQLRDDPRVRDIYFGATA